MMEDQEHLEGALDFILPAPPAEMDVATFDIEYRDGEGEVTKRRITPLSLKGTMYDGALALEMVEAFCHTQNAERSFAANGIRMAHLVSTGLNAVGSTAPALIAARAGFIPCTAVPEPWYDTSCAARKNTRALVEVKNPTGIVTQWDVTIRRMDLGQGKVWFFRGPARRPGEADWGPSRHFRLRGWRSEGAPVHAMYEQDGTRISKPQEWLMGRAKLDTATRTTPGHFEVWQGGRRD